MKKRLIILLLCLVIWTTVNDLSYYDQWQERGLCGIYTDYFYPSKWSY
jgi:hypothetical protein